jgi:hypothetical protein
LAVELRQRAQIGEHVDEIALAGLDLLKPRLRALLGAGVVMGQRPRQRAPDQNRSGAAAMTPLAANSSAVARMSVSTPWTAEASTMAGIGTSDFGATR